MRGGEVNLIDSPVLGGDTGELGWVTADLGES